VEILVDRRYHEMGDVPKVPSQREHVTK
jgi:hypothetical protein